MHKYILLTSYNTDIDNGVGYNLQTKYVLHCKKCKKEIEVLEHEYNKIMARQLVEEEYEEFIKQSRNNK